jgi:hypothetical protein
MEFDEAFRRECERQKRPLFKQELDSLLQELNAPSKGAAGIRLLSVDDVLGQEVPRER